jgi:FKBP-type peptidyl-prolyl cis-trans isomerase FkpA
MGSGIIKVNQNTAISRKALASVSARVTAANTVRLIESNPRKPSDSSNAGTLERLPPVRDLSRRTWLWLGLVFSTGCATGKGLWKSGGNPVVGQIDADAPTDFTATASGLRYKILRKSDGKRPKRTDKVTVHYKGWLDNGTVFDSSYERGSPTSFGVQEVIPGWTEGLMLIGEGGMIELEIPSELGYGARGAGRDIPPHAMLHFHVELIKVN